MSKMNNNSRKNNKNAKKISKNKRNSKKNFRIENLEPRLMMDASAGFDVEKIEGYTSQFDEIATAVCENISTKISSFAEFDVTNIGLPKKFNPPNQLFSESIDDFEDSIKKQVKGALNGAFEYAKTKIEEQTTNISLSQFVADANEFVKSEAGKDYKDISFDVGGDKQSKLIVNVKLSNTTDISGVNFDLGSYAKISASGNRGLSSSAEIQVTIDLDHVKDGGFLEDEGDAVVESSVIKKLETVIQDFGGSAKFMNFDIEEQTLSEETDDDLSMSYDGSLDNPVLTTSADLEFTFKEANGLPFEFKQGEFLKVAKNGDNFVVTNLPAFQMNEDFSLATKMSALIPENSFVNDLLLKIDGNEMSVAAAAGGFDEILGKALIALNGSVKKEGGADADYHLDAKTLQECLKLIVGESWNKNLSVFGPNGIKLSDKNVKLLQGDNKITLSFTKPVDALNGLNVYSQQQNNLSAKWSFAIDLTVNIGADGAVSFTDSNVSQFNLDASGIKISKDNFPVAGNDNKLNISLVDGKLSGALKLSDSFTMDSVLRGFSAADLPIFEKLKIPVESRELTIAEVASKMDVLWNYVPSALTSGLTDSTLNLTAFTTALNSALSTDYAGLESVFSSIKTDGDATTLNLVEGENNLVLRIDLESGALKKIDLDLFDLNNVNMNTFFVINVTLTKKDGVVTFTNASLQNLEMKVDQSVDSALFNDFNAVLNDGKFCLQVSVVNENSRLKVKTCSSELKYSGIELKSGSSTILKSTSGEFVYSYLDSNWILPNDVSDVISRFNEDSFSVKAVVDEAGSVPFLDDIDFKTSKLASDVDDLRTVLSLAILRNIKEAANGAATPYIIDVDALKNDIDACVASDMKNLFASVEIEFTGSNVAAFNVFDKTVSNTILGVKNGSNAVKLTFKHKQELLENLYVHGALLSKATVDNEICVSFDIYAGEKNISNYALDTFKFTVKEVNPVANRQTKIDAAGLVVSYNGNSSSNENKWEKQGVSFTAPTISFTTVSEKLKENAVLNGMNLKSGSESAVSLDSFIQKISGVWGNVFSALMSTVEWESGKTCDVEIGALQNALKKIIGSSESQLKTWLSNIKIVKGNSNQFNANGFDIWGGTSSNSSVKLTGKDFFVVFTFNTAQLNELNIHSQTFKNRDVDTTVALKIELSASENALDCKSTLESVLYDVDLKDVIPEIYGTGEGNKTNVGLTGNVQVLWDNNSGKWNVDEPEFVLDGNVALKSELLKLGNVKISALHDKKLTIDSTDYDISRVAEQAEECWNCLMEVLYSKLAEQKKQITTDAGIKEITDAYKTALATRINASNRLFNDDILVTNNGGKYTATFALKTSSIKALGIGGVNVGDVSNVTCTLKLSVDTSIESNTVVFSKATLDDFYLELSKTLTGSTSIEVVKDKYTAELTDATFKLSVELTGTDFTPVTTCNLSCASYDLKNGSSEVYSFANAGTFAFVNDSWQQPSDLKNYLDIADSDQYSLKKQINLADNYQLPYVGKSLKIGGTPYTVARIIDNVDEIKTKILLALQEDVNQNKTEFDLSKVKSCFNNTDNFLSALKLNDIDLLTLTSTTSNIGINELKNIEFVLNVDKQNVEFGSEIFGNTVINSSISFNVEKDDNSLLKTVFNEFKFDFPEINANTTSEDSKPDLTLRIESGNLNYSITKEGVNESSNVTLDDYINDVYMPLGFDLFALNQVEIPYIDKLDFSLGGKKVDLKEMLNAVDNYSRITQNFLDWAIDFDPDDPSAKEPGINLETIKNGIANINSVIPLGNVGVLIAENGGYKDENFEILKGKNTTSKDTLDLKKGQYNDIIFKISLTGLECSKELNLGLLELDKFGVEFNAYVKLKLYVTTYGWIIFDGCSLDRLNVDLYTNVERLNLGLFDVSFENDGEKAGKLSFKVDIDPNADSFSKILKDKTIALEFDKVKVGNFDVPSLKSGSKESISYNFDTGEWTLPESIRKFASFSSDNLITKVHTVLNTTQSALRNLVDSRTKLDFLDGSIEKVLDVVDKVEKVVYGDGKSEKSAGDLYGLCKEEKGQYQANFSDVKGFVDKFNDSWCYFIRGKDPKECSDKGSICSAQYYYLEGIEEKEHLDDSTKDKGLSSVLLSFELDFGLSHEFGLDFAKTLAKHLVNVSTCGSVHVDANAKIIFTLKIDFTSKKLDDNSTLSDIGLDDSEIKVRKNDSYITYKTGDTRTFDDELKIKIVKSDENDKSQLAMVTVNENKPLGEKQWYTIGSDNKADVKINYISSSNQIYITADQKFDIANAADDVNKNSPSGGDAFAELKLTGSNLQTWYKAVCLKDGKCNDLTFNFISESSNGLEKNGKVSSNVSADVSVEISFSQIATLVDKGLILEQTDKKKQINEFLGLQVGKNGKVTLFDKSELLISNKVAEGRSVMNTYGLYVVDVDETNNVVVFGCDSRLIQSGDSNRYFLCEMNKDSGYVEKITYMRVSGEITPSLNTTGMKGALVYTVDTTKKNVLEEKAVKKVEYIEFDRFRIYTESENTNLNTEINRLNKILEDKNLNTEFKFEKNELETSKWTISLVRVNPEKSNSEYVLKLTDNILRMKIDSVDVYVDIEKCLTVENLAETIFKTIKSYSNLSTEISSVNVVDGKIVFTAEDKRSNLSDSLNSITIGVYKDSSSTIESFTSEPDDFWIGDKANSIDFQNCITKALNGESSLKDVKISDLLSEINNDSKFSGFVINLVNDHFEISRSDSSNTSSFALHSIGSSNVLEWLGFTSGQESKLVNKEMKIVGSSVISFDWAKAISLENVKLDATLSLNLGHEVIVKKPSNLKDDRVTLNIDSKDTNDFKVDGFINLKDKYYRILKVNVDGGKIASIEVSLKPINGDQNLSEALKLATWKNAKYVASASASVGFLGVDVIAGGDVGLVAEFTLEKADDPEKADIFGFNVKANLTTDPGKSNEFSLQSYADVFGESIKLAGGQVELGTERKKEEVGGKIKEVESFKVTGGLDFNTDAVDDILGQFKNFSIEKLFAILETLLQRLDEITKNSDVKIPVINKSVRDLVNVANDLRDIIARLRADKVTTIQKFGDLLNTYLEEFHLTSHTPHEKLFKLDPIFTGTGDNKIFNGLTLTFNIQKDFSTRHRFSFGSGTSGVHGNIDLDVAGDFWFTLCANMTIGKDSGFDLSLVDAIKFGADIGIAGDKMRFDLGINAGDGKENLLSNLISVGSDQNDAFIYGKVGFIGSYGGKNDEKSLSAFKKNSFDYKLPIAIFGKLPVYACNMSLGDVYIGKCVDYNVAFNNCDTYEKAKKAVEDAMSAYSKNSKNGQKLSVLASSDSSDSFSFDIKTGTEEGDEQKELNGKFIVDFSNAYEKISELADFANMDWFSKIKLAVAGLNNLFEMLESSMNSNMGSKLKSVPVLGSALSTGVDFLSVLRDKVLDPFSKFVYESTGLTAEMVAKKLNDLFGNNLLDVAYDKDDNYLFGWNSEGWTQAIAKEGTEKGTWYRSDKDSAEWFFNLGGTYEYGKSIDFDLGFPGLGLSTDAGLNLSLSWALEFGFGISKEKGFYFIFGDGNEIDVKAIASLEGVMKGSLAGLGLVMDVSNSEVELHFGVDLNSPEEVSYDAKTGLSKNLMDDGKTSKDDAVTNAKNKGEFNDKKSYGLVTLSNAFAVPKFDFDASVDIAAKLTVGIVKDLDRNTPKFPNIGGNFVFSWNLESGVKKLGFYDLNLDMGSFISGVLGPIISKIQKVIEPLEPLIDFLTTPFPVLKDLGIKITPLDLAKKYSKGKFDDSMVYAIKDLIAISKTISTIKGSGLQISLGDFVLVDGSAGDKSAKTFLEGKSASSSLDVDSYAGKLKNAKTKEEKDAAKKELATSADKKLNDQGLHMEGSGKWEFIWSNPSKIFKLLLGEDIDLVTYTMPKLCFDFDWSTFVRIWGPLGARIGVTFSASIQLGFGYDTLGIRQWVKGGYKDYGRLLNGFYVADKDESGYDVNELSFYGGLTASAELNAGISAGVGGGVGINVGFNLYDPNKDGKVRLSEMAQIIKEDGLFGLFDVNGKITAKLYAYVDLFFYTKKWNITGDITLFKFDYTHSAIPVMASRNDNGDVVGNVGPSAGDRISTDKDNPSLNDGDEKITLDIGGKENRDVYWHNKDKHETVDEGKKLIIDGGAGIDKITLKGNANFDIEIMGGDGDDVIDLSDLKMENDHAVIIWGGSGNDTIYGAKGLNVIFGDTGVARIEDDEKTKSRKFVVDANVDAEGSGDDIIIGNNDSATTRNIIIGGAGNDKIYGGVGNDIIFGDGGKVEFGVVDYKSVAKAAVDGETVKISRTDISADGGNDVILGGAGDDYIYGGAGNDRIDGGAGEDHIYGERGHDIMLGGSDNDYIYGGSGHDIIFGDKLNGDSVDINGLFDKKFFSDEFKDAQFNNKELFNGGTTVSRNAFFTVLGNIGKNGDAGEDKGSTGVDHIYGEEGDDLIFGDSGTDDGAGDTIEGGIGNDIIDGNGGGDTISGGIDNDVIYGGLGDDTIDGGAGNDSLYGDNGIRAYDKKGEAFEGAQITFGENIGLLDKIYKSITPKSGLNDGNDKIMTGPGMDFVDGQGGSDQVFVNLMGESETNYANITDTGNGEFDTDTLTIEGTEYNDNLLMRMNKDRSLGFVALLPDRNLGQNEVGNRNIERVNFTKGIEVVNLNANGGDDKIYVDGTAKTTNIDGGAGDDSFQIGQFYNSSRESSGNQGIKKDDEFNTTQTLGNDKFLSDGVTKDTSLNVEGGVGNDSFIALRNAGALSMAGGRGNDTFSVYTYENKIANPKYKADDKDSKEPQYIGETFDSGSMSVDGGAGIDLLNVAGTTGDDTVIINKQGMLSDSVGIKIAGVETSNFDAGAGDDMFFVLGNNKGDSTIINGGHGNDTVSVGGGPDETKNLRSADTDGQKNHLKYEIITTEEQGLDAALVDYVDENVESAVLYDEVYTVIDTTNEPTVFYSSEKDFIKLENVTVKEGGIVTFYIGCSGNLKSGDTIKVKLTVPMLSSTALQHGDRGILIRKAGETEFKNEVTFELTKSGSVVAIDVKALSDALLEETLVSAINVQSILNGKSLTRSVNVVSVTVEDDGSAKSNEYKQLLTRTDEFRIQTAEINLGEFAKKFEGNINVYIQNSDRILENNKDYDIKDGILTLKNFNEFKGKNKVLVVNYRSNKMQLDGSKIRLVYDNLAFKTKVDGKDVFVNKLKSVKYNGTEIKSKEEIESANEIYYALYGDSLVFFYKANNRLATLHGTIEVEADARIADVLENRDTSTENKFNSDKFEIESVSNDHVIAEKGSAAEAETNFNTTKFKLKYTGSADDFTDDKSVFVKIYAEDVVSVKDATPSKQLRIYKDNESDQAENYLILEFNKDHLEYSITVYADNDNVNEEYGFTTIPANKDNQVISDVEGNIYAYGEGASMEADFDDPAVLRYNHKFKEGSKVVNASKFNEKNSFDTSKMGKVSSIDGKIIKFDGQNAKGLKKGCTVKFIKDDLESDWFYVESYDEKTHTFTVRDPVEGFGKGSGVYALFSEPKDYLFTPEADNTDRIFVNNQKSTENATTKFEKVLNDQGEEVLDSVRFTNKVEDKDKQWQGELIANNFEFGEYNLGSGEDTVDISKTHYREDGFQTFTVVNTGKGDDTINVDSYKNETDGLLVVNAEEGNDHVYAPNPELNLGEDAINKDGMVVIGGDGEDIINVGRGVIAFGDKGNIQYKNAKGETVTNLGYEEVDENNVKTGKLIRTKISKDPKTKELQKQTDGIVRGATSIKSVMDEEGAHDEITAGGTNSIIIGGADEDEISVGGDNNVVLGDNGEVVYITNESLTAKWNDSEKPSVKLKHVKTTSDDVGAKDTITISGNSNVAMGGAANDTITIGSEDEKDPDATEQSVSEENSTGNANVVLGDGGVYEFDKQSNTVTVHTSREEENGKVTIYGDKDEIKIYGGHNTVMGGAAGDDIDIYGADNIVLGDGGIAVRDDKKDVAESIKSVQTTDDSEGGVDNINVWGGDNTVMGGADGDNINIGGNLEKEGEEEKSIVLSNNNVVLGDGGKYERQSADSKTIETTHDSIGGVDTINIYGGYNTVMGGAVGDTINIGIAGQPNSGANNIILGDGGKYVENSTEKTVQTTSDATGGVDTIHVYGGSNVAMGGANGDKIYIGESGYDSDNNVVLGDGGKYDLKKDVSLEIRTTSDKVGGKDTIEIHGGQNTVMGGFLKDDIDIFGNDNVVLGDGGSANYDKRPEVVKGDTNVNAGLIKVETQADEIEVVMPKDDNPSGKSVRLNDDIDIHGDINIVMGGVDDDKIIIDGADNVVVGDAGVYTVRENSLTVETKSEPFGGQDYIQTGDGQNTILGGTDADTILTGTGNDIIVGDGGLVIMDKPDGKNKGHNPLIVTNSGKNINDKNEDEKSAGGDFIHAGDGNNVIFGGLGDDKIDSGKGEDVVFGDNGYATFRGNAGLAEDLHEQFPDLKGVFTFENAPDVHDTATLSFNFQGSAQQGIDAGETAGAPGFQNKQWNNISGSLAGTYGNDDKEIVRFDNGDRASSVSVTYAGREAHRKTSTDNSINAQNYNHWFWNNSADSRLMMSGIMTSSHNNQKQNVMEVTVDGLKQHFDSYQVAVYMDIPDAHSWEKQSVRLVSLYIDGVRKQAFYINDPAGANFTGEFKNRSVKAVLDGNGDVVGVEVLDEDGQTVIKPMDDAMGRELAWSNYVVFDVGAEIASDRIVIVIEDGIKEWNMNGKDLPGIAGIQVKGQLHKQDIAASTDVKFGGDDEIMTRGGDDIVVGGTGSDTILTHGGDYYIDNGEIKESSADHIIQQDTDIDEYVREHTTFDDERLGIYDNDVVFGDNAKMLFTERDGDLNTASTLTTAESVTISKDEISHSETDKESGEERQNKDKYKDYIYTGDGNDVVVGGIGGDEIKAGATPAADQMMDGINVFSVNFTVEHSDSTNSIASGESAGVVVDNQWHEFYRNNRGVMVAGENVGGNVKDSPKYNQDMDFLSNNPTAANEYAVVDGVEVRMYGILDGNVRGASSFTLENYDELDGDTSNSKLFNAYIAGQQNEEIVLNLIGLDKIAKQENNKVDESYDLYIYLGGDNNDKDTWEHLYEIKLTDENGNTQYRYLNDWTGHKFDGDYREAYCDDMQEALEALSDFTTPRVEIIGNYVVFHGVTGNIADIRIKNILSNGGQNPKNLPMITALQIVSGNGRYQESENGSLEFKGKHYELADIAVGGDHDKDLVYGDEAKLWFDLDQPFASDENIQDYKNRVIEAKSVAVDNDVAKAVSSVDTIDTGKDRDVAVGGEGGDTFFMGDGDDIALGGNANLIVEHNNPVGVFTPNTEIVLDQHTINTNTHQNFLDNDNSQVQQFQDLLNQHRIQGIDTNLSNENDRYDTFDMGTGRNLTYQDSWSNEQLVVPQQEPEEHQNNTENNQGGSENVSTDERVETIGKLPLPIVFEAGKTIKLVCTDYPKGDEYWTPNVCILGNNSGPEPIPELDWSWDGELKAQTNVGYSLRVDIPDHPNGENGMYVIYVTAKTSGMAAIYVDQ